MLSVYSGRIGDRSWRPRGRQSGWGAARWRPAYVFDICHTRSNTLQQTLI